MSNKIKIKRGLKAGLPNLEVGEFGLAIDTNEVFIGTPTGNELVNSGGGNGVDLNTLGYMNYAADIFYKAKKQSLFANAWEHSLTVVTVNKANYPNGEIEGVIIPQGFTSIGSYAFNDWTSNNHPLVIPNSVESIGSYAFYNWTSNNQPLVIPDSVTSIGSAVFYNWTSNNQPLVIPNSVTSIGSYAFDGWTSNNHPLVIPNSVTSISSAAFRNWRQVTYVIVESETPPTLGSSNAFGGQNNAPIYVPDESVDDYKTATNWVDLADRIFPVSDRAQEVVGGGFEKHDIVIIPDTTFTITQEHFNKTLIITSSSNVTITIPTQTVESIEKGFFCDIVRYGTGEVVFSNNGVVLNSAGPLSIDAQYIAVSLIKIDNNNEWLLIGGRE